MGPVERAGAMGRADIGHHQHASLRVGSQKGWPDAKIRSGSRGAEGARDVDVAGGIRMHRLDVKRLASDDGTPVQAVDTVPAW